MRPARWSAPGVILAAALAVPLVRELLEVRMVTHMLVELPLLCAAGWLLARRAPEGTVVRISRWDPPGVAGVLAAAFALMFWLLPRWLDAARASNVTALARWTSLLVAGASLRIGWRRLPTVGRGFVWANVLSMLAAMSWLFLAAPMRLCNTYILGEQRVAGYGTLIAALALGVVLVAPAFVDPPSRRERDWKRT